MARSPFSTPDKSGVAAGPLSRLVEHCKQLECLDVGWMAPDDDEALPAAIRSLSRLPKLRQLHASFSEDTLSLAAVASLTRITHLGLRFLPAIDMSEIVTLLPMRCLSVLELKLVGNERLEEGEALALVFGMSQLVVLEVPGIDKGTQELLLAAAGKLRQQVGRAPELNFA